MWVVRVIVCIATVVGPLVISALTVKSSEGSDASKVQSFVFVCPYSVVDL